MTAPDPATVSIAIASFNSRQYLREAVESALAQRGVAVEVIIVDDGSDDGSDIIAERFAASDPRVRFFRTPSNLGPGGARNIALANMTGLWFAVLDSDDLYEPERCQTMIAAAASKGADMVADDMVVFTQAHGSIHRHLGDQGEPARRIDLPAYLSYPAIFGDRANLGFLKPIIRSEFLARHGLRYDASLRIGEDDMFVIRCLENGARYIVLNQAHYRYRKHAASISHRLSTQDAQRLLDANVATEARLSKRSAELRTLLSKRSGQLADAVAFSRAIDALKARNPFLAAYEMLRRPGAIPLFAMPLRSRLARLTNRSANPG
ncbi:glycosyltransferase family 2 protein [Croceicoccus marinus]|uniref:Glycosyltransferase family 2 protein n=1 Tax=Croceicoccus marinus TaxID=450378 RepID=A0A7G6VT14_9SPHN|nr:glycosyltransferase family 2 protein [Croceicoccus marinus]QNE04879.1 glycosyltransferase family 2 protein [Croceicoccus marinus]